MTLWRPSTAICKARDEVVLAFGVTPHEVLAPVKLGSAARARHAAVWVLKQRWPNLTNAKLAAIFNRNNSTIIHSQRVAEQLRAEDQIFREMTDRLTGPRFPADEDGRAWCKQCERRVREHEAAVCRSEWCSAWAA